ncbi:MAG: DUF2309 domain-containing protein [Chitinophagaceae bacterium]|nr:DUF2309 domain-containing protein [Chitinophagaceae bacterium]
MLSNTTFNLDRVLHDLKHYLPSQTPLKDFIHHNSLHAFQHMKFYDAIFKASEIFGYQATLPLDDFRKLYHIGRIREDILNRLLDEKFGKDNSELWKEKLLHHNYSTQQEPRINQLRAYWKKDRHIDLDNEVQPLLFRILSSYLDQGIAIHKFPLHEEGFLASIKLLESTSSSSFFKTKKVKQLLFEKSLTIEFLLERIVGNSNFYTQYLFDQQFSHRGWSGMVATLESRPDSLLDQRSISLQDLILFELLIELDVLTYRLGASFKPLCTTLELAPIDLFAPIVYSERHEVIKLWQDAFEWSYYDEMLAGIAKNITTKRTNTKEVKAHSFQALFCIDERECSLRTHVERTDTLAETFGCPGFFGVEFYFQAEHAKFYDKLCPAPVTPKYLIKEYNVSEKRKHDLFYSDKTHEMATGFLSALTFGFWAGFRLIKNLIQPKMAPAISNAFAHMNEQGKLTIENKHLDDIENGLQIGFTVSEMTQRVEALLRGIGLLSNFAPIIYVVAHGSSSANNPHHGAHDCGACSGRPGSVNARVFAAMANHHEVRNQLVERGIEIPEKTQFVGALHDTAADEIEFYDVADLNSENRTRHQQNEITFDKALDLNAKERSRRFASIDTKADLKTIRKAIKDRSVSLFEPRPELGHGTNTLCIVGSRQLSKGVFLDRRAFLNSYNVETDREGKFLTGVMAPLGPVCGGINLEYYFSRVDNYKLGAGTKLPHNVVGLFGVANSSDGDLRPGLPWQMIEVHDPVRLLIIVEHFPDVILKAIQSTPAMYEWYINEWVHLISINPDTHAMCYFKEGEFIPYQPIAKVVHAYRDVFTLIEESKEMETNHIVHATQENLPVYLYEEA